VFKGLKTDKG